MHIHILGICGTFMGGIACLAKELGHRVSGSDQNIYPPMSTQLEKLGIELHDGYHPNAFKEEPDVVVIGNALSRGNSAVEYVLDKGIRYQSGPEWLAEHVLQNRHVLAVAGTHGKTTTTSMLSWILEYCGMNPGFLIGGVPENFGVSARLGQSPFFVVEADEYDTAFFDKRSKFVHYHPRTCLLNNLEFDHADIFPDLAAIEKQFHHLIRTVPGNGLVLTPIHDDNLNNVLKMGLWSLHQTFGLNTGEWHAENISLQGNSFEVWHQNTLLGKVEWSLIGSYNVHNAIACIAAAAHAGMIPKYAIEALSQFKSVKRRMELKGIYKEIALYDDFAHHPTAIKLTLEALRSKVGKQKIHALLDLRSNTMRLGTHKEDLPNAVKIADEVYIYQSPDVKWNVEEIAQKMLPPSKVYKQTQSLIEDVINKAKANEHILVMSNGGFDNIHLRLIEALK